MWKPMLAVAVAAGVITTSVALAQTPAPPPATSAPAPAGAAMTKAGKPLTPKQEKAKDCRAKWKEQKKTGAKGRTEYRNFMKTCTTS